MLRADRSSQIRVTVAVAVAIAVFALAAVHAQFGTTRVPDAPSNLSGAVNGSNVTLTWTPPAGGEAVVSYQVEVGTVSGAADVLVSDVGATTVFTAPGPAGTFAVAVRAVNALGQPGPRSNEIFVTLPGGGGARPGAPTNLSAVAAGGTVTMSWLAPANGGAVSSYEVRAALSSGGPVVATLPAAGTNVAVPNVAAGTYFLTVVAIGPGGTSGPSGEAAVTVGGAPPPPGNNPCGVIGAVPAAVLLPGFTRIFQGTACSGPNSPVVEIELNQGTSICSGTAIAANALLTAAHCVIGGVTADTVIVGGTTAVPVASTHPNPSYDPNVGEAYDLAVIITAGPLGVPVVPILTSRDPGVGEQIVFAGYGGDRDVGGTLGVLRAGANAIATVTPDTVNIDFTGEGSNTCGGDSGGPMLVMQGTEWVIAGVTSRGDGNCENPGGSVFSNTQFPEGLDLILGTVPGVQQR